MEEIGPVGATIIVAIIAAMGTLLAAYINNHKPVKKKDQTELNFERMDKFIEQQIKDREDLRNEIRTLRDRVDKAETRVDEVETENKALRKENASLRRQIAQLRNETTSNLKNSSEK